MRDLPARDLVFVYSRLILLLKPMIVAGSRATARLVNSTALAMGLQCEVDAA
jgi:hypothetical protein